MKFDGDPSEEAQFVPWADGRSEEQRKIMKFIMVYRSFANS